MEYNLNSAVPRHEQTPLLTQDEEDRLVECLFYFEYDESIDVFSRMSDDSMIGKTPLDRLILFAELIGPQQFGRELVRHTLEIYHEAKEWLFTLYAVALMYDAAQDIIIDSLLQGREDERGFVIKVMSEMETEMSEQLHTNVRRTPFDLFDPHSTRVFFETLYRNTLQQILTLKTTAARRRLLL